MVVFLQNLYLLFYSQAFYRRLIRQATGIGIEFILLVTLLGLVSAVVSLRAPVNEGVEKLQATLESMPEVTVKDHKLSIDQPAPYTVKLFDADKEPNKLVIDPGFTSDVSTVSGYMNKNNIFMLVTSDKLVTTKGQNNEVQVDDLSTLPDGKFTHAQWASLGATIAIWMLPLIIIFCAIGGVIANFILVLLYCLVVKLLGLLFRVTTDFEAAMRLAAVTVVPASVVALLFPVPFWVQFVVSVVYMVYGLSAVQTETPSKA